MMSAEDILETHLGVDSTAEWRWRKAEEFPEDDRNEAAAKELETIASEITGLNGSPIIKQIDEAVETLNNLSASWDGTVTVVSKELGSIGFHSTHSGLSLLEWYRDLLFDEIQECLDEKVPIPDLGEQVENEPAVRAARQAYEQAKAKALAKARKKL
jgi:hypothetical protein